MQTGFRPFIGAVVALISLVLAAPGWTGVFNPQSVTLANGLQVVVIPDHRAPVVNHMVWYRVGAADETPGESGLAHFLEHLMFRGTTQIKASQFSKIVARNGGNDNAFTAQDYTGYFQNVARNKLDLVMGLEADRMVNLQLDEDTVRTERNVVLEERRSRTDNNPAAQLGEAMRAAQFMAHPYGIPVIGWKHEMERLSLAQALAFYRRYYVPNNAILIVAGDVTLAEVRELAEKHFGPIPRGPKITRRRPQEPPQLAPRRVIFEDARVRQPSMRRTYLAPSRSAGEREQAVALRIFSEILGGDTISRLYQALVVEQKIASGAGSWYHGLSYDRSTFGLYATPVPGGDVASLERALDAVVAEVLAGGITEAELKRAKNGLLASIVYARDDLSSGPRVLGTALTTGLSIEDVESWPDEVERVTAEGVMAAARAVFDKRRSVTGLLLPAPAN
ncbi:MAG: pitrilysin family protein [Alphaproteobacteria bacterium]|jgi:zinc protease|nr:pitrilysin family protein [Alphaproteobacteria bacterium]